MSKKKQIITEPNLIVPNMYDKPATYYQKGGVIEHPARVFVLGPSASGKTNLVMFLVTEHFEFDTLTIFAADLDQPLFVKLKNVAEAKIKSFGGNFEDYIHMSSTIDMNVEDFDSSLQHLVVFDDMVSQKSKTGETVAQFFMKGRPRNISSIVISQNLFNANTQVRENTNYLFSFAVKRKQDRSFIYSTYCQSHLTQPQFDKSYAQATKTHTNGDRNNFFSVINTDKAKPLGMTFRRGLVPYSLFPEDYNPDDVVYSTGGQYKKHWKSADITNFKHPSGPIPKSHYDSDYVPKKKKQVIVEESSDEDTEDSDDNNEPIREHLIKSMLVKKAKTPASINKVSGSSYKVQLRKLQMPPSMKGMFQY